MSVCQLYQNTIENSTTFLDANLPFPTLLAHAYFGTIFFNLVFVFYFYCLNKKASTLQRWLYIGRFTESNKLHSINIV